MKCTLCHSATKAFFDFTQRGLEYVQCTHCHSVLLTKEHYPTLEEERAHYLTHENDVNDPGYQKFVDPIVRSVVNQQNILDRGLDFGSGTGPVISKLLKDMNYEITTYDPFFDPNTRALLKTYNYIICCEVIEHFQHPYEEFKTLVSLLEEGGRLYCMTQLYHEGINFRDWRYKNDPTHLIFYHADAVRYIEEEFGFSNSVIDGRLVIWEK